MVQTINYPLAPKGSHPHFKLVLPQKKDEKNRKEEGEVDPTTASTPLSLKSPNYQTKQTNPVTHLVSLILKYPLYFPLPPPRPKRQNPQTKQKGKT